MKKEVKDSLFPVSMFVLIEGALLVLAGIHYKLLTFLNNMHVPNAALAPVIILYWLVVATILTLLIKKGIRKHYDNPLKAISDAAEKVAGGDFSVYVPPLHTAEKLDYLDQMIMDFNKMVEELGSIETLKTDFFANVSHEIKTPIAIISNAAEMLKQEELLPEKRREYVETILQVSQKLSGLITNILKINKLEKQTIQPCVAEYDLCRQLCDCIVNSSTRWEEKEIELEADMEDERMIEADECLLELVWDNLLSNAVKFSEKGGHIRVRQTSEDDIVIIKVEDDGCGMSEQTIHQIFEKFYQGDTSHATEGNGLGLAMVKRCIDMMGGSIEAESEPGKGSTFTVLLPQRKRQEVGQNGSNENDR